MSDVETISSDLDFSQLHERMQWYVDEGILPNVSTLVLRDGDVLDYSTCGFMDVESKQPLAEDAIYRMFSNTKKITSVAAMMLCEQGRLELDNPLAVYLPTFADVQVLTSDAQSATDVEAPNSAITVRHVLSHSAGFSYGFIQPDTLIDQLYIESGISGTVANLDRTLEEFTTMIAAQPLAYQPGTSWRYSVATDVLARLVEVCSGQLFDEFLQQHIFEPLGMRDTGFFVPRRQTRSARQHVRPEKHARSDGAGTDAARFSAIEPLVVAAPAAGRRQRTDVHRPRLLTVHAHALQWW